MSSPVKLYQRELHTNLGYFATWLPSDAIQLGDIGVLQSGRFHKLASLQELGIPCVAGNPGRPQAINYYSTADTRVNSSVGASAPGLAKAEVAIKFSRQGAFLFQALGVQSLDLADRTVVSAGILQAFEKQAWKNEWLVVDSVYLAESATVIVSEDAAAEIVLRANSALPLGALPLADPKLGLTVSSTTGKIVHVIAASGLHPLYSCLKLKDPLFGSPSVVAVRGASPAEGASGAFARPSLDELLDS